MKVLITGANGFLGVRLANRLVESGWEVRAMVRRPGENPELKRPGIEEVKGDVRDRASLDAAMKGVDRVFHLAALSTDWARDFADFYRINAQGTVNLLEAAKAAGVGRVVNTSTAGAIGPPDQDNVQPVDETHLRTIPFLLDYEASKAMADAQVLYHVLHGMDIVTVNPTRVFGPGPLERKNGYLMLINNFLTKKIALYPGIPKSIANFVHIDDVVEGMLLAMEKGKPGESYLLGGHNVTFMDLFAALKKVTGRTTKPVKMPLWLLATVGAFSGIVSKLNKKAPVVTRAWLKKAQLHWPVSSEKAKRELGYNPMDYETAVHKTVEWLEEERKAGRIR